MPPTKSNCRVSRQSNHQLVAPLRGTELWSDGILGRKQDLRTLHERHSASLGTLLDIHSSAVERVRVHHGRKLPRLGRATFADLTKGATMSVNSGHSRTNTTAPHRGRRATRCPGHWTCGPKWTGVGRKTRRAAAATSEHGTRQCCVKQASSKEPPVRWSAHLQTTPTDGELAGNCVGAWSTFC